MKSASQSFEGLNHSFVSIVVAFSPPSSSIHTLSDRDGFKEVSFGSLVGVCRQWLAHSLAIDPFCFVHHRRDMVPLLSTANSKHGTTNDNNNNEHCHNIASGAASSIIGISQHGAYQ